MRAILLVQTGAALLVLLTGAAEVVGQLAGSDKAPKNKVPKGPFDEESAILKQIEEAYKAPFEVHEDVLKELRKSYQQPSLDREAKIFKDLRRLYDLTADEEATILREIRRAYQRPSSAQEERIFRQIELAQRIPSGTVPASVQVEQAQKAFQRLDQNGDGLLSSDEMPDALRADRGSWDANRDGFIDLSEYRAYFLGRIRWLSEGVAAGQIELRTGRVAVLGPSAAMPVEEARAAASRDQRSQGLPDWFVRLDTDGDGQLGLYEWKKSGWPLQEFFRMDRNGDGFVTAAELTRYLSMQSPSQSGESTRAVSPTVGMQGYR